MKRTRIFLFLLMTALSSEMYARIAAWQFLPNTHVTTQGERRLFPHTYSSFYLNSAMLKPALLALPEGRSGAQDFDLPLPDGSFRTYKIWQTPMMEPALAEKYSGIKTFTGYAIDDKNATLKLDITYKGVHAKIFDGTNTYFIDPYSHVEDGFYICYYKKDYPRPEGKNMSCEVVRDEEAWGQEEIDLTDPGLKKIASKTNGTMQKTYRLALACTIEYAQAVDGPTPTKAGVLSAMVTSINRVNGVYERELAVTMILIGNNDTLIYLSGTDPYSNSNGGAMLSQNQTTVTNLIGAANYDIGHVFSTGGGGIAQLGCVCSNNNKARGVTGSSSPLGDPFDIDYVAHEMGHQFGSDHTFNANSGSCSGNGENAMAYEPGGGTTIMAYAGICGSSDNIQNHSDDYFHAISLIKISDYITLGNGANCPVQTPLANGIPTLPSVTVNLPIPAKTPFELVAPEAVDTDHDVLTYCWEQWNLGDFRASHSTTLTKGPIFRSDAPSLSTTRVFPPITNLSGKGEQPAQNSRYLTFILTVRDMLGAFGSFTISEDTVHLDVINTGAPFVVIYPNAPAINWTGGTTETITWDVAGTDAAPINASHVDIYLSVDGGHTYPYTIAQNIVNDGSEALTVPNVPTTSTARVKIKGAGNVFFNISNFNLSITNDPNLPPATHIATVAWSDKLHLFPIPASKELHIKNEYGNELNIQVFNTIGQQVWSGKVAKEEKLNVSHWAKGMYYMQLTDVKNKERSAKKFVVE